MNKGIKISNKPWIIFLNSGDTFYNKFVIKNLILILKKNKSADIIVGNNLTKISNFLKSNRSELNENNYWILLFASMHYCKNCFNEKNLFNLEYKYAADFDFFIKMLKKKKNLFILKI